MREFRSIEWKVNMVGGEYKTVQFQEDKKKIMMINMMIMETMKSYRFQYFTHGNLTKQQQQQQFILVNKVDMN